jgi:chromosome segregation ATPase
LISVLDQWKDKSIERTFKGVAKHFREVFSELVQGGHGYFLMMKKKVFCFTPQPWFSCTFSLIHDVHIVAVHPKSA